MARATARASPAGSDGIRRGDRRRRAGRARRRDPPEAAGRRARPGDLRRRAREGLGGRRAHPVRRGDRSDRPRPPDPGLEGEGRADHTRRSPTTASSISARPAKCGCRTS